MATAPKQLEIDIEAGDDFEDQFEAALTAENQRQERASVAPGRFRIFSMPGEDPMEATIRFLVVWKGAASVVLHVDPDDWKNNWVCPGEFGMDCPICDPIMKKEKLTRKAFKKNLAAYSDYKKHPLELWSLWPIWHYEEEKDPKVKLFAYKINPQSPLSAIHKHDYKTYVKPEEDEEPVALTEYDVQLTQIGKDNSKRQILPEYGKVKPFKYTKEVEEFKQKLLEGTGRSEWTPMDFRFGFALSKAYKDIEYSKRLQVARHHLTGVPVQDEEKLNGHKQEDEAPSPRKQERINLEFGDE